MRVFDGIEQDLRYGFRVLARAPGFTAVAVLTLALGIGANAAIFSLTDQILLRRLPVQHPEELVVLRSPGPRQGHTWSDSDNAASFSYPMYKELREAAGPVFSGLLARFAVTVNVAGKTGSERVDGELVSGDYFAVLGVGPALGRVLSRADETAPGADAVTVLSYDCWRRRFGGDPGVVGRTLTVNGTPLAVVGVARAGFDGVQVGQTPDLFIPITLKATMTPNWDGLDDHRDFWLAILGRLQPGLGVAAAEDELKRVFRPLLEAELPLMHFPPETQERFLARTLLLDPGERGRGILQAETRQALLVLAAMVGVVLLIVCANLASLQVARGEARRRELAVRQSLGAGRRRLVGQLLAESLLLALAGAAVGLLIAGWTLAALIAAIPENYGALGLTAELDLRVLAFAVGLSVATAVLFGLAPALRSTRVDLNGALKEGSRHSAGRATARFRHGLIGSQVALTAVLLTGAGLFTASLIRLQRLDLGFQPERLVKFSIAPELNGSSPAETLALVERLRQRLAALPGVVAVGAAELPVLADTDADSNVTVEGFTPPEGERPRVQKNWIGPGYLAALGTPPIAGRELDAGDGPGAPKVAVVNETFVRRYVASGEPIGRRFAFGDGSGTQLDIEIVGVVRDSKHMSVRSEIVPFAYLPYAQDDTLGQVTFYVRSARQPAALLPTLRDTARAIVPDQPIFDLKTLERQLAESLFTDRLLTLLSVAFGLLAALLAAVGLYGVLAQTVARRTREIGIRMALGATRERVGWLVLREIAATAGAGLAVGLVVALAAGRLVESQLFGVHAGDPVVYAGVAALLAAVAALSAFHPVRRAVRVGPSVALRYE